MWKTISLYGAAAVAAYGGYLGYVVMKYGAESLNETSTFVVGAVVVIPLAVAALAVHGIVKLAQSH